MLSTLTKIQVHFCNGKLLVISYTLSFLFVHKWNNYLPKVYSIPFKSPARFEDDNRVTLAQDAINRARAAGDEEAVEAIKNQLRLDLGITNLGELIK